MINRRFVLGAWCLACGMTGVTLAEQIVPQVIPYQGAAALSADLSTPLLKTAPRRMENLTLREIAAAIEELTDLQVRIDWQAFSDAGLDGSLDQIIPLWDEGETIERLADRMESGTELTWTSQDGVLTLTTAEYANERYSTARYFIGDLLKTDRSADSIIELLQAETSGPWDIDEPGTGTISSFGNHLFIRQTLKIHREVEGLLAAFRRTEPILLLERTEADLAIIKLLDEHKVSYDWPDVTLGRFQSKLQELVGCRVELDEQALTDAGLDADARLNARARNLRLGVALNRDLENVNGTGVTFSVRHGILWLTTTEKADETYETVVYNLESLGITGPRIDELIELLKNDTGGPWHEDEPGTGTIMRLPSDNRFVVRQTRRVHSEILGIISSLRDRPTAEALFHSAKAAPKPPVTRFYKMNSKTAEALLVAVPVALSRTAWRVETKAVPTSEIVEPPSSDAAPSGHLTIIPVPAKTDTRTKEAVPADPDTCFLSVTHTPEVHEQVAQILLQLGVMNMGETLVPNAGGGGGFFSAGDSK